MVTARRNRETMETVDVAGDSVSSALGDEEELWLAKELGLILDRGGRRGDDGAAGSCGGLRFVVAGNVVASWRRKVGPGRLQVLDDLKCGGGWCV